MPQRTSAACATQLSTRSVRLHQAELLCRATNASPTTCPTCSSKLRGDRSCHYVTPFDREQFEERHGQNPIANATLSVVSITIIYSYLAIESFVNYQLYRLWERRHDGSLEATRFLSILIDTSDFHALSCHSKVRELGERIKTLCAVLGYKKPHEAEASLWQSLKELSEVSRHFLVHPYPDGERFNGNMDRIMTGTETGRYAAIAEGMLKFFYAQDGQDPPEWARPQYAPAVPGCGSTRRARGRRGLGLTRRFSWPA